MSAHPDSSRVRYARLLVWLVVATALSEVFALLVGGGVVRAHHVYAGSLPVLGALGVYLVSPEPRWRVAIGVWALTVAILALRLFGLFFPGLYGDRWAPVMLGAAIGSLVFALAAMVPRIRSGRE